ncbi:DUF7507 domain-containing protein [Demequina globuliformis]|uniref:DUF7927 domain-containing protein n=1 Tax=Demequina globuliformis TaxID=676202 RepID=UPI0007849E83|nr:GEVED domain-containing protein [Demequina globuliformis]
MRTLRSTARRSSGRARNSTHPHGSAGRVASVLAIALLVTAGAVSAAVVESAPASAAPGTPGQMQPPAVAWIEDFQNIQIAQSGSYVNTLLPVPGDGTHPGYVADDGQTYSQDPAFALGANCNGLVVKANGNVTVSSNNVALPSDAVASECGSNAQWTATLFKSLNLGRWYNDNSYPYAGQTPGLGADANNYSLSVVNSPTAASGVVFETAASIPTVAGHTYMASIDLATMTCQTNNATSLHPQITLTSGAGATDMFASVPDSCATSGIGVQAGDGNFNRMTRTATFVGENSVVSDGSPLQYSLSLVDVPSLRGHADNAVVLDATPQLDKDFLEGTHVVGQQTRVTFTVTNTHMPFDDAVPTGPKVGWSFEDALPPGLEVSSTPDAATTCTNGTISGTGGTISGSGDLSGDSLVSCTLSINVTATVAGTYTNAASDVTTDGLTLPADADVLYVNPGQCPSNATLWQGDPTHPYEINLVTGDSFDEGSLPDNLTVNAVGYNELDGYYYGTVSSADSTGTANTLEIAAISPDYQNVIRLGEVDWADSGWTSGTFGGTFPNVGDVSPDGIYYARAPQGPNAWRWIAVDVRPGSSTFMEVIDNGRADTNSNWNIGADWAFVPSVPESFAPDGRLEGTLWAIGWNTNNFSAALVSYDPLSGASTSTIVQGLGRLIAPNGVATQRDPNAAGWNNNSNTFGAVYADLDGYLYGSTNGLGHIWRVNVSDPSDLNFFAYGPSSTANDGARCQSAPVSVDFADAPDTYSTLIGSGGPYHELISNDLDQPLVMIGSSVSRETNGQPSPQADADNDDAFAEAPVIVHGESGASIQVPVTNNGGESATLVGWVDFDQSGTFEDDERAFTDAGTSSGTVTLSFPNAPDVAFGNTFMRLRLAYEDEDQMPTDTSTVGAGVRTGEVEDWAARVVPEPSPCLPGPVLIDGDPVDAYRLNLVTGESALLAEDIVTIDAAGYNTNNGYVYGVSTGADTGPAVVLATGDGEYLELGEATNSTGTAVPLDGWTLGDMDQADHLWVATGGTDPVTWARINTTYGDPTFLSVVAAGTAPLPSAIESVALDWAFDPASGNLYTLGFTTGGTWALVEFDTDTEAFETVQLLGLLTAPDGTSITGGSATPQIGGVAVDGNGFLYATSNDTGQIWRVALAGGATDFYSYGPAPQAIDAVGCPEAVIPVDFGDAPNSFGTTLGVDGARHSLIHPDGTDAPEVYLGAPGTVDDEFDGQPGAGARGDDTTGGADEEGLAPGTTFDMDAPVSLAVAVTNNSDTAATVAGWVDLNGDGTFTVDERATAAVPANAGETTANLTFDEATTFDASVYVRLRIVPGAWDDPTPDGPAADGEIEDHRILAVPPFPLECTPDGIMTTGAGPVDVVTVTLVTGEQSELLADAYPDEVDALGYNPLDNYLYGATVTGDDATEIVRVGADGTIQVLGIPMEAGTAVPLSGAWTAGDIDAAGQLWLARGDSDPVEWARVDLDPSSATFLDVVASGTADLDGAEGLGDWAVVPDGAADPVLYSLGSTPSATDEWTVVAFDTAAGTFATVADVGVLEAPDGTAVSGGEFPAVFTDQDGYFYAHHDASGLLWRLSVTGDADFFAYGASTEALDGARCPTAAMPMDFGDLPDEYFTTLNADGARHALLDFDADAGEAPLMLGFPGGLDAEFDGAPSGGADGDDVANVDDEDAVQGSIVVDTTTFPVVPVAVTNNTDEAATLVGFIDFDGNDVLDVNTEQQSLTIPANTTGIFDLVFPIQLNALNTYGRIRLLPGVVDTEDLSPYGAVIGGEVEDFPVLTAAPEIAIAKEIVGDPAAVFAGEVVTYEVTLTNPSGIDYTTGAPARFIDDLTDVLDDATWVGNVAVTPTIPADVGSWTFNAVSERLVWQGPLAAGESVTITYDVMVDTPPVDDGDEATVSDVLTNSVTGPTESNCPALADPQGQECFTTVPVEGLIVDKSVTPEGIVAVGDTVEFTITAENFGATTIDPVVVTDDLAEMVDDGTYQGDAAAVLNGAPAPDPTVTGDILEWSGAMAPDDVLVLTFSFIVDEPDAGSNGDMSNVALVPGSNCVEDPDTGEFPAECTTETLVGALSVSKSVSPVDEVHAGDDLTYTVTVENTGGAPLAPPDYAYFDDDLTDVLLEATLASGPTATLVAGTGDAGTANLNGNVLHWESPLLNPGAVVEVEYTVSVDQVLDPANDHVLTNAVTSTPGSTCGADSGDRSECSTEVPIRALEIAKSVAPESVDAGGQVTYTVEITNTGAVDYDDASELASFDDDLSAVLDDAEWDDNVTIVPPPGTGPGATDFDEASELLSWEGPLGAGETTVVTYTVTVGDPPLGDHELGNLIVGPEGSTCEPDSTNPDCSTTTPVRAVDIVKTSPNEFAVAGGLITYQVVITNTGDVDYTADDPLVITDTVSAVLDDAVWLGAVATPLSAPQPTFNQPILTWEGPLAAGDAVTVTYTVRASDPPPAGADGLAENTVVGPPESNCDANQDPVDPDCAVTVPIRSMTINKQAEPTDFVDAGDQVVFTVTVQNSGQVAYGADGVPLAHIDDDLSEVLDDATWDANFGISETSSVDGNTPEDAVFDGTSTLTWDGTLDVGETVTIQYAVIVDQPDGTGNGQLDNAVVGPPEANCSQDDDPLSTECTTNVAVRALDITKTADVDVAQPGGTVTYTIAIENTGDTVYLDASVTDDLTDVLTHAQWAGFITPPTPPEAAFDADTATVAWTGDVPVGEVVEIQFQVELDDPVAEGAELVNTVVGPPGSTCEDDGDPDTPAGPGCTVTVPVSQLDIEKAASESVVSPGEDVTYTIAISNTGSAALTDVTVEDDLNGVLNHAEWVGFVDPVDPGATFEASTETIAWTGDLAVGGSVSIVYTVNVDDEVSQGAQLVNAVTGPEGSSCEDPSAPGCTTTTDVRQFDIVKTASPDGAVVPGATVTYSVTVTNTGSHAYADPDFATVTDDLSDVLLVADGPDGIEVASNQADHPETEVAFDDATGELTWTGPLAVDEVITITYDVTVDDPLPAGVDSQMDNLVVGPPESNCETDSEDGDCGTTTGVKALGITKTSSASGPVGPGDDVTYTVTIDSTGSGDYTEDEPAVIVDDLSDVLDDASNLVLDSTVPDVGTTTADEAGETLTWEGPLAAGTQVIITYTVTIDDPHVGGNGAVGNAVTGPPESSCDEADPAAECSTTDPVRSLDVTKTSDAGGAVIPGQEIEYTITVTNTGSYTYTASDPARVTDDLSNVEDDADLTSGPTVVDLNDETPTVTLTYTEPSLLWEGELAPGEIVEIHYTVTVLDPADAPDGADGVLTNAVVNPDGQGPCDTGEEEGCTTTAQVRALAVSKITTDDGPFVDGDTIEYVITVTNTGAFEYTVGDPARVSDDLSDVLQGATWDDAITIVDGNTATASGPGSFVAPTLTWTGALASGESVEIRYTVTVDDPATGAGDGVLVNAVTGPPESTCAEPGAGEELPSECTTTSTVRGLTIVKTVNDAADIAATGTVEYTVTVTNTGGGAYTDDDPVVIVDDVSQVDDDASFLDATTSPVQDPANPPIYDGSTEGSETITWTGPLAGGESIELVYAFSIDDPSLGDGDLFNAVTGPEESNCYPDEQADPENCQVLSPDKTVELTKRALQEEVVPGELLTYEITVTNPGFIPYGAEDPAYVWDDISDVLDNATWIDELAADSEGPGVTLAFDDGEEVITWTGPLAAGETVTITYTVQMDDPVAEGATLVNTVAGAPESNCFAGNPPQGDALAGLPEECTVTVPVRQLAIEKASDVDDWIGPYQTVTYEVAVRNTGSVDYEGSDPVIVTDDLSGVLDDATYLDDAVSSTGEGSFQLSGTDLTWTGPLVAGEEVLLTYSVRVNDPPTGDGELDNVVEGPPESTCEGNGCVVTIPVRSLDIVKTSDAAASVVAGEQVEYTVVVANTGTFEYTLDDPATITDDLSGVLDDAMYLEDAEATGGTVTVSVPGETLRWTGALAPGESVTITYSVQVDAPPMGDGVLDNTVTGPPESVCAVDPSMSAPRTSRFYLPTVLAVFNPDCSTQNPIDLPALDINKRADAPAGGVQIGDTVTFTVTATNTGDAPYTDALAAVVVDDLTDVLDDANFNNDAAAEPSVGTVTMTDPYLRWEGPLEVGETVTLTYSVTVTAAGDQSIVNVAFQPANPACEGNDCIPTPPGGGSGSSSGWCVDGVTSDGLPCDSTSTPLAPSSPPAPALPVTGGSLSPATVGLAGLLVALGAALVLGAAWRRRRDREVS